MLRPGQVFADRVIVGEVAVVDQGLVQTDERMRPAGMPNAALGGIALVGDPDVGPHVGHAVILHGRLGKAHDLHDDQVPGVGEDEGPLVAQRGIELACSAGSSSGRRTRPRLPVAKARLKPLLVGESGQHVRLDADEIAGHVGRPDFQQRHVAIIVHRGHHARPGRCRKRARCTPFPLRRGPPDPTGPPGGCNPRRAPCARRPTLRAPARRRRCRRPCRCRGSASGSTARRCACRPRGSCRRSRSRRSRLRLPANGGTSLPSGRRSARDRRICSARRIVCC